MKVKNENSFLQLEEDFKRSQSNEEFSSLFSNNWPGIAKKIIQVCKKSKSKDVKSFFQKYQDLIDEGME